ncbi:hypothetical protein DFH29DRAFT_910086, partial [Suillus ampliporus]
MLSYCIACHEPSPVTSQQAVFVAIASFTVLCWDHIITFGDEVRSLIWCKRKGPLGYLFLLVRETICDPFLKYHFPLVPRIDTSRLWGLSSTLL